ncbi:TPA: hypothetical protein NPP60_004939 [Klebsiella variicola subsp. variicola]|nr:hypothetical protein [Klebsiella variicola subsp. variicola]
MVSNYGLSSELAGLSFVLVSLVLYIGSNPFYFFDVVFNLIPFVWLGCVVGMVIAGYCIEYTFLDRQRGKWLRSIGWALVGVWLLFFAYIEAIEYLA